MKVQTLLIVALTLLITGCTKTVVTPGGTAQVSPDGQKTTYQDFQGNKVETKSNKDGSYSQEVTTADGKSATLNANTKLDYSQFNIKEYPNISTAEDKNSQVTSDYPEGKAIISTFITKDSPKQVIEHFANQCDKVESKSSAGEMEVLSGTKGKIKMSVSAIKSEDGTTVSATFIEEKK